MKSLIKGGLALACLIVSAHPSFGDDGETKKDQAGTLKYVVATTKETQVQFDYALWRPFLAGEGPLTKDNNLRLELGASVSPVSFNGSLGLRLTPLAPLQWYAGVKAGSGWNLPIAQGLRINEPETDRNGNPTGDAELTGGPLAGVVWSFEAGGLFQFDLAALFPGAWNHAVLQTYHALRYKAYTGASKDESWLYEADEGENRNGWNYYGVYFLGYRMPIALDLLGILVEENLRLYASPGGSAWGDRLPRWTVGPLANYSFTDRFGASLLLQFRTARNFTSDTEDKGFYQDRRLRSESLDLEFYRVALTLTWKLFDQ